MEEGEEEKKQELNVLTNAAFYVMDATRPFNLEPVNAFLQAAKPHPFRKLTKILVLNKIDLNPDFEISPEIAKLK